MLEIVFHARKRVYVCFSFCLLRSSKVQHFFFEFCSAQIVLHVLLYSAVIWPILKKKLAKSIRFLFLIDCLTRSIGIISDESFKN